MMKGLALVALSLALEAAFLLQIAVIAPQPKRLAQAPVTVVAAVVTEADGETIFAREVVESTGEPRESPEF